MQFLVRHIVPLLISFTAIVGTVQGQDSKSTSTSSSSSGADSNSTTIKKQFDKDLGTFEKKKKGLKKKVAAFEKKISFDKLKHHVDSVAKVNHFVHEQHSIVKSDKSSPYNVKHAAEGIPVEAYQADSNFQLKYEVFGWYPHWEDESEYYKKINYSLLTTMAYFSYEVDPATGKSITEYDWESTPFVDSAKANGVKALLTVSLFGESKNTQFLSNSTSRTTLIEEVIDLIEQREAHGVCLDFEGVPQSQALNFAAFITEFKEKLTKKNKAYLLYITVPSVDWSKSLDFKALIPNVDYFIIMGYGYYGPSSTVAGPIDGLFSGKIWEPFNLSNSVDYYLSKDIPNKQLILALPFYGSLWTTETEDMLSKTKSYIGARSYDYIKTKITSPTQIDTVSISAWTAYEVSGESNETRQCWFESDSTLSFKLNYVKSKGLAGMGIWALGYDKGYPELWGAIASNMCDTTVKAAKGIVLPTAPNTDNASDTGDVSPIAAQLQFFESVIQEVTDYKTVIIYILAFLVFFGGAGLLIAMFEPNTRLFFFGDNAYTTYYVGAVLVALVVILRLTNLANNGILATIIGFIVGGLSVLFIRKVLERINRDKP